MSGVVNKIKDVLHKDGSSTTHSTSHGVNDPNSNLASATAHSTNHGGHDSNLANKVDPRIDSDRDGSRIPGQAGHSGVSHAHGSGLTSGSTNAGPHSSNLANKADPRIDSDRDGSNLHNTHGTGLGSTTHQTGNTYGTGVGSTGHTSALGSNTHTHSTNAGPHDSNIANKLDPRVDSDNSKVHGSHQTGNTQIPFGSHLAGNTHNTTGTHGVTGSHTTGAHGVTGSNTHGVTGHSTNAGPHSSNLANKVDPLVDSDLDGRGNRHGANTGGVFGASGSHATSGSGTAQNTAGPHNSDLLNKLDPRVDSDKDGSKTVGGNKTHA